MTPRILILAILCSLPCLAWEEAPKPNNPEIENAVLPNAMDVKNLIQQVDEHRFRIGTIQFDRKTREIRFPCEVNMTEGILEYLIVHKNGNVHESLLSTDISATHLNIAFKLLNYQASPELYAFRNESGGLSENYPKVPEAIQKAARIRILLEWEDQGKTRSLPVGEWIQHNLRPKECMPDGPWVYGGSEVYYGKFLPESTGDVCAIFATNSALINYPGEGAFDDTIWNAYAERVPKIGTKVTVVIAPYANAKPSPSP